MRIHLIQAIALAVLGGLMPWIDAGLEACDTPVFQQALEVWEPDRYQARVLHHGRLSAEDAGLVQTLRAGAVEPAAPVNVEIGTIDLREDPSAGDRWLAASQARDAFPKLVLRYPLGSGAGAPLWSGPLTSAAARGLLDSPVRREIARRLMDGDAIVFVLLETGSVVQDSVSAGRLRHLLADMKTAIEPFVQVEDLKPTLSMVRLSRNDPAEQVLVRTLLGSEPDLESYADRPIVFPVFGRGRVLCALVGEGISRETIQEVCAFLVGPCSCLVKAENPGFDLLMGAAWERVPGVDPEMERDPLPLVSVPGPRSDEGTPVSGSAMDDGPSSGDAKAGRGGLLANSALLALAAIGAAVVAGSILLRRAGTGKGPVRARGREDDADS